MTRVLWDELIKHLPSDCMAADVHMYKHTNYYSTTLLFTTNFSMLLYTFSESYDIIQPKTHDIMTILLSTQIHVNIIIYWAYIDPVPDIYMYNDILIYSMEFSRFIKNSALSAIINMTYTNSFT